MPDTEFAIREPVRHATATVGTDGCTQVTIDDFSSHTYQVTIYFFPFDTDGTRHPDGPAVTLPVGGSFARRIPVDISVLGPGMNRFIEVMDNQSFDTQSFSFHAALAGSGVILARPAMAVALHMAGQVVPHAITSTLDAKVTKGTCAKCADLNKPALLVHSDDAKQPDCWLSRPIAFCGKGAPAGFWRLKKSTTTWTLELKQEKKVHVAYTAKTKSKDCSLPVKLTRKGAGSKACKTWPKTITIAEA